MPRRATKKSDKVVGRDKVTAELQRKYERGASIRAIAKEMGRSYGYVHRVLSEAGTQLRGRGGKLPAPSGVSIRESPKKSNSKTKTKTKKKSSRRTEAEQLLEALPDRRLPEFVRLLKGWLAQESTRRSDLGTELAGLLADTPDAATDKSGTGKTLPRTFRTVGIFEGEADLSSRTREILRSELRGEGGEIA